MRKLLIPLVLATLSLSGGTVRAQSNYEPYFFRTVAGNAPGSADGTGSAARFDFPNGVAVDSAGNVYVADSNNHTIRKITPSGVVSTLAGLAGSSGSADGTGSAARFNYPTGVAVDSAGNIYVADQFNHTIRKITSGGVVSTLAGLAGNFGSADGTGSAARFNGPEGVAVDTAGNVYVADTFNNTIRKITSGGVVSTLAGSAGGFGSADGTGSAARFFSPVGVAVDSAGNVYVADTFNNTIRKITSGGVVSTLAGLAGNFGSADGTGSAARFFYPSGVAVDSAGNVYVADYGNNTIRKVTPSGVVSTLAGLAGSSGSADGTGSAARFSLPASVAVDSSGNLYVGERLNYTIRKITVSGVVSTLAGLASPGSADATGTAARFNGPEGVAVDTAGNVYVADTFNNTIRKITSGGVVTTLAGLAGNLGSADGTGTAARFDFPCGAAVDSAGNVYVADSGNDTIRKITPSGIVSTFAGLAGSVGSADGTGSAARFNLPASVAVDSAGTVYVADQNNNTIRKIASGGVVSTLAGLAGGSGSADGTGSSARFFSPSGLAVDSAGNVYVADQNNNTIRKIASGGVLTTLAGLANTQGRTDGTGSVARFRNPSGVAVDSAGNVYVADQNNNSIREGGPPVITSPLTAKATVGQQFTYQFQASGATSLAVTNLPPGVTFNPTLSAIVGSPTQSGTFQVGLSASNVAGTTTATLTLTVQPAPPAGPVITSSTSATARVGLSFSFQVITTGGGPASRVSATGLPPGLVIDAVTGLISGTPTAGGSSAVSLTITDGNQTTTSVLQLTFTADPTVPVIISSSSASLTPGQAFSYTIVAPATSDPSDVTTYTLVGTLPNGLFFDANAGVISGTFTPNLQSNAQSPDHITLSGGIVTNVQLFATNSHGTSTIPFIFYLAPTGAVNIATRLAVGTGDNVLIAGFIITGNAPKKVVIRAIAPSLTFPGTLPDPMLELYESNRLLASNDNWRDTQENEIMATTIPPTNNLESAILAVINSGNYTAIVKGKNDTTGIAVVEVYDLGTASLDTSSNAKLAQISTRGNVLRDDNVMIGGFILSGQSSKVIVRAIGPSLNGIVPGALQDPMLELHNGSGATVASNDDWRSTQEQAIIDTTVPPKDDRESAIVATLPPGNYTGIVRGKNNDTGVGLVEVYSLD